MSLNQIDDELDDFDINGSKRDRRDTIELLGPDF